MDDNGNFVTEKENEAYRFDDLCGLEGKRYRRGKKIRSADALYIKNDGEIYLFEFKNVRKSHVPWKELYEKAHDSLFVLQALLFPDFSLRACAERINFYVIYNNNSITEQENNSEAFEGIRNTIQTWAKAADRYPILWGLGLYEGTFYKKVMTIDVADFEREFLPLIYG